ncbi:MAG: ABC transporter permease [Candidatus Hydrogenedentes bacterium]|nr:ABC transporter permease [Candidatus Hydrogenedentota bacterium]
MRILAVAMNTFRESVRDKVLYVLLLFAAATILSSKALGYISVGQDIKIVVDISLASVSIFGALIAVFVGTNLVYKEVDKRTIYTILSRPLWRYEFILGKYFGLALLITVVTVVMTAISAVYVLTLGGNVGSTFFFAALLIYWKLLLVTALSVLLSTLTTPILGAIIVFFCYVLGHATGILVDLPNQFEGTVAQKVMTGIYYVIPNLSNFDIRAEAANGVEVAGSYIVWALAYGTMYTVLFLTIAALAFENKDV